MSPITTEQVHIFQVEKENKQFESERGLREISSCLAWQTKRIQLKPLCLLIKGRAAEVEKEFPRAAVCKENDILA